MEWRGRFWLERAFERAYAAILAPIPDLRRYADHRVPWDRETEWRAFRQLNCLKYRLTRRRSRRMEAQLAELSDVIARRYRGLAFAEAMGGQWHEDDDRASDALFGLTKAMDRFDYRTGVRFSTYVTIYCRRRVVDGRRDRQRADRRNAIPSGTVKPPEPPEGIAGEVKALLGKLSRRERAVVERVYGLNGLRESVTDIAARRRLPVATVKSILGNAMKRLRRE